MNECFCCRHLKAHLGGPEAEYINLDSLDEPQLMAQYFRNFDLDKDGKVDGLEMLKAIHRMNSKYALTKPLISIE